MMLFQFALQNLASRPARSVLALMGLTVAIAGMVGLFSVAVGIDRTVDKTFSRIKGLVAMQPGAPIPLFSRIPAKWAEELVETPGVKMIRPELWTRAHVVEGKATFNPPRFVFGTDIAQTLKLKQGIYRDDIVAGRFLAAADAGTKNCVISRAIADQNKKQVGDSLRVDGNTFTIVGIYHTGSMLLDVAIVLDQQTVRALYHIEADLVSSIFVEPDGTVPDKQLVERLQAKFRGRNLGAWKPGTTVATTPADTLSLLQQAALAVLPLLSQKQAERGALRDAPAENSAVAVVEADDGPGLEVRSAADWGQRIQEFSSDLDIFLWLMNTIGVAIALLSILNTMLMSVSERMIEFGILRANGWSSWDVLKLISWESALLGLVGGLFGCGLGWTATTILNALYPLKLNLYASPGLLSFSLGFSILLGVLGGLYPAWWATRMSPMEAIRRS